MSIADAMADATAELKAARIALDNMRQTVSDQLATKATAAQTTINNFINRAPSQDLFVDVNLGTDAVGFGTLAKPYKTFDYALDARDQSVFLNLYMLTDDVMRKSHNAFQSVQVIGAVRDASAAGFVSTERKLAIAAEGADSPYVAIGRGMPFIQVLGGFLRFNNINIQLPAPPAGVVGVVPFISYGIPVAFSSCRITVETADSRAILLATASGTRMTATFSGTTLGPNVPGKLFSGVAAGANPNNNFSYETNLASA